MRHFKDIPARKLFTPPSRKRSIHWALYEKLDALGLYETLLVTDKQYLKDDVAYHLSWMYNRTGYHYVKAHMVAEGTALLFVRLA